MLIISQNLVNYDLPIPSNAIFRINLAWIDNIDQLIEFLKKYCEHDIFLDLPTKRIKPPNNNYTLEQLIPIIKSHPNIKYLAISNVESSSDLKIYDDLTKFVTIVPKIESVKAIHNIKEIITVLNKPKIMMLDHDDLFSSVIKMKEPVSNFKMYVNKLIEFCKSYKVTLLRARGIIFSD